MNIYINNKVFFISMILNITMIIIVTIDHVYPHMFLDLFLALSKVYKYAMARLQKVHFTVTTHAAI